MRLVPLSHPVSLREVVWLLAVWTLILLVLSALPGCGSMNAAIGGAINAGTADAQGAIQNQKAIDDRMMKAWADAAGALTLGALGRNGTGNPQAVQAALLAAGVNNIGVVTIANGQITVSTGPNLTAPYAPAASTITPAAPSTASSGMLTPSLPTASVLGAAPTGTVIQTAPTK